MPKTRDEGASQSGEGETIDTAGVASDAGTQNLGAVVPPRPSIISSTRWLFAGSTVSRPVQFLNNVVLARVLGPSNLGAVALANSAAVTFSGIVSLGVGDTTTKVLAEHFRRDPARGTALASFLIWFSIGLSSCAFCVLWLLRPWWQASVFPAPTPDALIVLSLVLGWFNLLSALMNNAFAGVQLFRDTTIMGTLQIFLIAVCSIVLAFAFGPVGAVLGYLVATAAYAIVALLRLRAFRPELLSRPRLPNRAELGAIVAFALPQWAWALLSGPLTTLCFVLLAAQPGGVRALGVFNTANGAKMVIALLPALLANVINPAILEEGGRHGKPEELRKLMRKSYVALRFLALPSLAFVLFGSDLIFKLYGRSYEAAPVVFLPLAASAAITVFCLPTQYAVVATGKVWWNLIAGALQQICLYLCARWWVHDYLANGLAWAFFASQMVFLFFHFEVAVRLRAVAPTFRKMNYWFAAVVCALLAAGCYTPAALRPVIALPMGLFCAVILLRLHNEISEWIGAALPAIVKKQWHWISALAMKSSS